MNRRICAFLGLWGITLVTLATTGCSGGSAPEPAGGQVTPVSNQAAATADPRSAKQVVETFLACSQSGNTTGKVALLTPAARAEWEKAEKSGSGFSMGVEASPTLVFKVGDEELVGETKQEAHVASVLTEKSPDGEEVSENIVWFVLQEPEGWRISGMAMNVIDGELPLILDFEDQAEMARKIQMLNTEIARREKAESASSAAATAKTASAGSLTGKSGVAREGSSGTPATSAQRPATLGAGAAKR